MLRRLLPCYRICVTRTEPIENAGTVSEQSPMASLLTNTGNMVTIIFSFLLIFYSYRRLGGFSPSFFVTARCYHSPEMRAQVTDLASLNQISTQNHQDPDSATVSKPHRRLVLTEPSPLWPIPSLCGPLCE